MLLINALLVILTVKSSLGFPVAGLEERYNGSPKYTCKTRDRFDLSAHIGCVLAGIDAVNSQTGCDGRTFVPQTSVTRIVTSCKFFMHSHHGVVTDAVSVLDVLNDLGPKCGFGTVVLGTSGIVVGTQWWGPGLKQTSTAESLLSATCSPGNLTLGNPILTPRRGCNLPGATVAVGLYCTFNRVGKYGATVFAHAFVSSSSAQSTAYAMAHDIISNTPAGVEYVIRSGDLERGFTNIGIHIEPTEHTWDAVLSLVHNNVDLLATEIQAVISGISHADKKEAVVEMYARAGFPNGPPIARIVSAIFNE